MWDLMISVRICTRLALTGFAVSTLAALPLAATAVADPQSSTLCPEGARTSVPDGRLQCRAGMWQPRADKSPAVQWLTYGPPITLSGEHGDNPDIAAGTWLAQPQEPKTRCRAAPQSADATASVTTGDPGQSITVQLSPTMDSVTLSGDCLWRRIN